MDKRRAEKGKKYWLIHIMWNRIYVTDITDMHYECDRDNWNQGNYFNTKEEAEAMAEKIRKVLKGAEVIEIPSEEEISEECDSSAHEMDIDDGETPNSGLYWRGWGDAIRWLKSKIVE